MVLKYTNKTNFILLDGFARVCSVSANFPDNPRIRIMFLKFRVIDCEYIVIIKSTYVHVDQSTNIER